MIRISDFSKTVEAGETNREKRKKKKIIIGGRASGYSEIKIGNEERLSLSNRRREGMKTASHDTTDRRGIGNRVDMGVRWFKTPSNTRKIGKNSSRVKFSGSNRDVHGEKVN